MRLHVSNSKNSKSFYVIESTFINQKNSSRVVEKLGTEAELREKLKGRDPYEWAKEYIAQLNRKQKEEKVVDVIAKYCPAKQIEKGEQQSYNGGYLFLQKIYHELGLHKISKTITDRHAFEYNLNSILSRLLYTRILYPSSKRNALKLSQEFVEAPDFELHQIYRALDVLQQESDYIQSEIYKNSLKAVKRNTKILYYDCTNYFFEIEQEEGLKQYGVSKEHRPNPIVQMGLFMDGDGLPLAFCIHQGNTNEQSTLKPLEKKILQDFELSKFIVCTDAGLSSKENRLYNDMGDRGFITTQSLKKIKKPIREWALETKGWKQKGSTKSYDISMLDEEENKDTMFYKEQILYDGDIKQRLIVTYSIKYRDYQRNIRNQQLARAEQTVQQKSFKLSKSNPNDFKRFIQQTSCTKEGEIATKKQFSINYATVEKEEKFDGFYAVCTNVWGDVSEIINVNKRRWEIEESFRIMKTEFKSRPVYLKRDERIKAHFLTCFLSLLIYRLLEKHLNSAFTCEEIIQNLKNMRFTRLNNQGYIPTYTRNDFTDALHEKFGFRTDYEITTTKEMKKIITLTKK